MGRAEGIVKIILANDIDNLGRKGDVVIVADGYARNYLVPKGLAMVATRGSLRQAQQMQRAREEQEQKAKEAAEANVARLTGAPIYISARAGEGGRLFGSVTKSDIARGVEEQLGEVVDRHKIILEDPIHNLGTYQVEVHLHEDVKAAVIVEVIAHDEDEAQP
jgi:large subunit ribosomal protein L9